MVQIKQSEEYTENLKKTVEQIELGKKIPIFENIVNSEFERYKSKWKNEKDIRMKEENSEFLPPLEHFFYIIQKKRIIYFNN